VGTNEFSLDLWVEMWGQLRGGAGCGEESGRGVEWDILIGSWSLCFGSPAVELDFRKRL